MRSSVSLPFGATLVAAAFMTACAHTTQPPPSPDLAFHDGWRIQSSAAVRTEGSRISRTGFDDSKWTPATIPTTVYTARVRNHEVPPPFEERNLETASSEPYAVPWWYRKEFTLLAVPSDARLLFEGINYSAEVWVNGKRIAGPDQIVGTFRVFDLPVTSHLRAGTNVLAVKVFPPKKGDPTIGFVDWNPSAPDAYMGLWRGVTLKTTRGVSLDDVWVRGDVDPKKLDEGQVSVSTSVSNRSSSPVTAIVRGRIGPDREIAFEREITLKAGERREIVLGPEEFPQLVIASPRLWWPNNLGEPNLYSLQLEAVVGGHVSDHFETAFGIRHISDYINEKGHRGYAVNGKPVLLRGGGWVDDILLTEDPQRLEDQIRYVRHMNLNMIRLEGFWGSTQRLFDLADRFGIMVWVGWSCQWEWEDYLGQPVESEMYMGIDTPSEIDLIDRSFRDQVVRLRNHPSVIVWNLGSDKLPVPELERRYLSALTKIDPTRPALGSCKSWTSEVTGPTAVKMAGPYEWVPPNYWYEEKAPGGAFGFNTETGPGAQPPVAASIRRMLPEKSWWPIDDMWAYHSARHEFKNLDRYVAALNARYGPAANLDEFGLKAQMVNYEGMRAMFEAFSLRRPVTTGIVQWMLNSAWPKMFWQLYDYYLVPTGAFYGARDASRPVHIAYDYGAKKIVAVNDTDQPLRAVAKVRVFDGESRQIFDATQPIDAGAGERREILSLPPEAAAGFRLLDARIEQADGALLDANLYVLPAEDDVLDWGNGDWFFTPVGKYADLTPVNHMPPASVDVEHRVTTSPEGTAVDVTLRNTGKSVALFIELALAGRQSGTLAAPVFWDANYISLVPGETRKLRATYPPHALSGEEPVLTVRGMNVGGTTR